jgi:signal transduction histidine kinase
MDITDRKAAENALHLANKKLQLLSSITRHDILNQLMALRGYLELSAGLVGDPERMQEYIRKEEKAAETIEQQITFTRDYQELGVAAPVWLNVTNTVRKTADLLPLRTVRVEAGQADVEVLADKLFEKVCYNLIDNALRYGGPGMTTIRFTATESDQGLLLVCEDDGAGISPEDKKHLFSRGYGKNTGLGLFLSREILSITGITISETGEPGKGARFEIFVPEGAYRFTPGQGTRESGK